MAITVTTRGFDEHDSNWATTAAVGAFTPADNSLLVIVACAIHTSAPSADFLTLSGGSLTYTKRQEALPASGTGYDGGLAIYTAPVSTGSSMTVTATSNNAGSCSWIALYVFELSGEDAYVQGNTSATDGDTASTGTATYSADFSSAPASDSYLFAACYYYDQYGNTHTLQSGWTEAYQGGNADHTSAHFPGLVVMYRTGTTALDVDFTVDDGGDTYEQLVACIEISAEAGAPPTATPVGRGLTHSNLLGGKRSYVAMEPHQIAKAPTMEGLHV